MVLASELRAGMALRLENQVYRVLGVDVRAGTAKMNGTVRARLQNVRSGRLWEQHFRLQERLPDLELEKRPLQFLFSDGNSCTFLRLDSYEQVEVPAATLGFAGSLLRAGTEVPAEFFEDEFVSILMPQTVEARVVSTAPAFHGQQDSTLKEAKLENGGMILVPPFIATGETVNIDTRTGHYVDRVRSMHKKSA